MNMKETYVDNLRKSNFKITPQRLEVIKFLDEGKREHFTAEDVYHNVKAREPTITLATVYNILRALRESGNINSFEVNGKTWFETNVEFHGNLVCNSCGKITDVNVDRDALMDAGLSGNYTITGASLVLKGLCPECSKSKEASVRVN